jgi:DNA-binding NtrC family response regulator
MKILVVDDEERFARLVADDLKDSGHEVTVLTSGADAAREAGAGYDVVITDLKMTPVDGIGVLEAVKAASPETEVIVMTAFGAVDTAVEAMKKGAADFITKPFAMDQLQLRLERSAERLVLKRENQALKLEAGARLGEMVGASAALRQVKDLVAKVAPSDASVLILGESGVGKELVARLIHRQSRRAGKPFVVVHAAALPETLLESELFGYERGAFTGAATRKLGRLEMAEGGTLFLDEIGEISPAFQVKLLRFVQERTFTRLGGNQTIKVDARVVTATNRDLMAAVREGRFREDLYYRLAVFPITVPPLRERKTDLAALAGHVLARLGCGYELKDDVMQLIAAHDWPGNVRELENVLERAMILSGGAEIRPQHIQLPEPVLVRAKTGTAPPGGLSPLSTSSPLLDMEKQMLEDAMRKAGGNKSKAAKLLGITRRMLYTKLERYGLATGDSPADE